jgi:hypothetical protein
MMQDSRLFAFLQLRMTGTISLVLREQLDDEIAGLD